MQSTQTQHKLHTFIFYDLLYVSVTHSDHHQSGRKTQIQKEMQYTRCLLFTINLLKIH